MGRQRRVKRKYDPEFIANAVAMVIGQEMSINYVAKELCIPHSTINAWVDKAEGRGKTVGKPSMVKLAESPEQELSRLRKKNHELRMEADLLKKTMAFFAKKSICDIDLSRQRRQTIQ